MQRFLLWFFVSYNKNGFSFNQMKSKMPINILLPLIKPLHVLSNSFNANLHFPQCHGELTYSCTLRELLMMRSLSIAWRVFFLLEAVSMFNNGLNPPYGHRPITISQTGSHGSQAVTKLITVLCSGLWI